MLKQETIKIQEELGNYCKTENKHSLENHVTQDRLHHYRRLIYNIIDDALENAYPITKKQLSESNWNKMVNDFVSEHSCINPQLFKMPGELISFAEEKNYAQQFNIPYLVDLLNFEWIEVEVHSMKDVTENAYLKEGDFMHQKVVFSPYFEILELDYPVHLMKKQSIKDLAGDYYMLVYREDNGTVQYLELNALTAGLITTMYSQNMSLYDVLSPEMVGLAEPIQNQLIDQAQYFIFKLRTLGIIKGVAI